MTKYYSNTKQCESNFRGVVKFYFSKRKTFFTSNNWSVNKYFRNYGDSDNDLT